MMRRILWLCVALLMTSCYDEAPLSDEACLVVDGRITDNGFAEVVLTRTLSAENGEKIENIVAPFALVTLSDGEGDTTVLSGMVSHAYVPPYVYQSFDFRGRAGHTYTLRCQWAGLEASATCTMPPSVAIDSVCVRPTEVDSLRRLELFFTPPVEDGEQYYHILVRENSSRGRALPAMMGTLKTRPGEGQVRFDVRKPKVSASVDKYHTGFVVGDVVSVELCRVSREVWAFYMGFDDAVAFGGSFVVSGAHNLPTNVVGGLGVFSAEGCSATTVVVK